MRSSNTRTLFVYGTAAVAAITVSVASGQVVAEMDGAKLNFPEASVKRMSVDAGDGDDVVANQANIAQRLRTPPSKIVLIVELSI